MSELHLYDVSKSSGKDLRPESEATEAKEAGEVEPGPINPENREQWESDNIENHPMKENQK